MDSKAGPLAASTSSTETKADLEAVLRRIEARLERLEEAIQPIAQARSALPALAGMAVDVLDEAMARAAADGVELERLVEATRNAVLGLARLATAPEVKAVLDSGMFDPGALSTLGLAARAVADASAQPPRRAGILGAMMAARQPSVQRALGLLITVAENLGASLEARPKLLLSDQGTPKPEERP